MPFTLSHAAAAIPFHRSRLVMSAIVVGCFVPDISYFLTLSAHRAFSHTVTGMFVFDLPLGMILLWAFHAFVREPMLLFFPGVRRKLAAGAQPFLFRPWKRFWLIVLSILAGTSTHLVWDVFTHRGTWIYRHWRFLHGELDLPVLGPMKIYKLMEFGSSVLGLVVVAVWICYWYQTTKPSTAPPAQLAPPRAFLILLPLAAIAGGAVCAWFRVGVELELRAIVHFATDTLLASITIFLVGLLVYGIAVRQRQPEPVGV
jgi:hypothetical protein